MKIPRWTERLFQITYSGTYEGSQDLHVFAVTNLFGARKVGPGPQNKTSLRFANRGFCQATGSSFLVSLMYPQVHSHLRKIPSLLKMSVISFGFGSLVEKRRLRPGRVRGPLENALHFAVVSFYECPPVACPKQVFGLKF